MATCTGPGADGEGEGVAVLGALGRCPGLLCQEAAVQTSFGSWAGVRRPGCGRRWGENEHFCGSAATAAPHGFLPGGIWENAANFGQPTPLLTLALLVPLCSSLLSKIPSSPFIVQVGETEAQRRKVTSLQPHGHVEAEAGPPAKGPSTS